MIATTEETVIMDVKMDTGVLPVNHSVPQIVMNIDVQDHLGIVLAVILAIGETDVK